MGKIYILITVVFIVFLVYCFRNFFMNKISSDLMNVIGKDEEKFLKLIDSTPAKILIEPYNRDYMKLNHYIITKNNKKIDEQFNHIDAHKLNKDQTLVLYRNVFKYYISIGNREKSMDIYNRLCSYSDENNLDPKIKIDFEKDIKVYLDKDIQILNLLDERLSSCKDEEKALLYLEKTYVLKYNNKLDEALECMENVIKYTVNPSQKKIMQDIYDSKLEVL